MFAVTAVAECVEYESVECGSDAVSSSLEGAWSTSGDEDLTEDQTEDETDRAMSGSNPNIPATELAASCRVLLQKDHGSKSSF